MEFYTSLYRFDEGIAALPSLAGLPPGTLGHADFLALDLDSPDALDVAYRDSLAICSKLDAIGAVYECWFSGGKGFHVLIPTSQFGFEPTADEGILKRMAEAIKGNISTWDASIYNKTRMFRYPNTWNEKGGHYKVHIFNLGEPDLDSIKQGAKERSHRTLADYSDLPLNEPLCRIYELCKTPKEVVKNTHIVSSNIFAPAGEGGRNESAYTLANLLFKKGLFKQDVEWIVGKWNEGNTKPLPPFELGKVIYSAEKGRIELAPSNLDSQLHSIDCMLNAIEGEQRSGKTKFKTGYSFLDDYTFGFEEEELIYIAARSGNFKTALLTRLMQRGSYEAKKQGLFFSMEMGPKTLRPRMIQSAENMTKSQVIGAMLRREPFQKTREEFKYLTVVYLSNLTTEQMMDLIEAFQKKYGDPCAIGIDYLSYFKGCMNNTERTARQAQDLKTVITKAAKCPTFCLVQAKQTYEGREGDIELTRNCAKDSDSVLDTGDYSIGIWGKWWTFPDATEDKLLFGKFLKSRGMDSEKFEPNPYMAFAWQKDTLQLNDILYVPKNLKPNFRQLKEEK